jgi:hypothetical protein
MGRDINATTGNIGLKARNHADRRGVQGRAQAQTTGNFAQQRSICTHPALRVDDNKTPQAGDSEGFRPLKVDFPVSDDPISIPLSLA